MKGFPLEHRSGATESRSIRMEAEEREMLSRDSDYRTVYRCIQAFIEAYSS